MPKVKTTGRIFLFWVLFLVVAFVVALFQWINGTTDSARNGGQIFAVMILFGLLLSIVYFLADRKWRVL